MFLAVLSYNNLVHQNWYPNEYYMYKPYIFSDEDQIEPDDFNMFVSGDKVLEEVPSTISIHCDVKQLPRY